MKFILVRHGETDYNKEHKIQGLKNNLLNDSGRRQARKLRISLMNQQIDVCYMSPLVRAVETAMILVGDHVEMIPDNRLVERDMGNFEGVDASLYQSESYWDYSLNLSLENIEPIQNIFHRCQDFLDYIMEKYDDHSTILIVTHGAPFRVIHHILKKTNLNSSLLFDVKNCSFEEIEISKN